MRQGLSSAVRGRGKDYNKTAPAVCQCGIRGVLELREALAYGTFLERMCFVKRKRPLVDSGLLPLYNEIACESVWRSLEKAFHAS